MIKRLVCSGLVGGFLFMSGAASSAPSYCPTTAPTQCFFGRRIGDLLVTLHGSPPLVVGLRPSTRNYYIHKDFGSASELGDIMVVPNNPTQTVVIGNVDNLLIGVQRLDRCGGTMSPVYGQFPSSWPAPWPPIQKQGTNNRGIIFNPLDAQLFSPGNTSTFFDGSGPFGALFRFPIGGGAATILPATGSPIVDTTIVGAVAADEFGDLYLGQHFGSNLAKIHAGSLIDSTPIQIALGSGWPTSIRDIVHDGNRHLFVTDNGSDGHGMVWRVDVNTGITQLWTNNLGAFAGGGAFNGLFGITIDDWGNLWVVEQYSFDTQRAGLVEISGQTGEVLDYFQMPATINGSPVATNSPQGIAVYGVNLPAVRERCASTCTATEVSDCFGDCVPAWTLGDANCDDGPGGSLNCYARGFDHDDCNYCGPWELPDCNGNCAPKGWVGDSICDQGGWNHNGNWIDFDCADFRFDEGTCDFCAADETLDCNRVCAPASWLGDSTCDAGTRQYFGALIDFDCVEHDFDQHRCQ